MRTSLHQGETVFIDANIFLSIIFEAPATANPSVRFLEHVHDGVMYGATSVIVLNEIVHRLLIAEAVQSAHISAESAVSFLKSHPQYIQDASTVWSLIDDIKNIQNLKVYGISEHVFTHSIDVMRKWGLMSNDALHIACMKENSIDTIVTYDRDFERIPQIKILRP
jgi:predicted nucleic acid-binding protein